MVNTYFGLGFEEYLTPYCTALYSASDFNNLLKYGRETEAPSRTLIALVYHASIFIGTLL